MTVFSRTDILRHTPARCAGQADAPVYLIRPARVMDRMLHARDVRAAGSRFPGKEEMLAELRRGIEQVVAEESRPLLLELVDAEQTGTLSPDDAPAWAELERVLTMNWPPAASLVAERQLHLQITPYLAFRRFVTGWENVAVPYRKSVDLISEDVMEALPIEDVLEAGWAALLRSKMAEAEQKNLPSPSPSGDSLPPLSEPDLPTEEAVGSSPA